MPMKVIFLWQKLCITVTSTSWLSWNHFNISISCHDSTQNPSVERCAWNYSCCLIAYLYDLILIFCEDDDVYPTYLL